MSRESAGIALRSLLALREKGTGFEPDGGEPQWLAGLRELAWASFEEQGFPTRRLEAWKSINLAPLEAMGIERIGPPEALPEAPKSEAGHELVFVDGRFAPALSHPGELPSGCRLLSLAAARREMPALLEGRLARLAEPKRNALVALQTAFLDDGAVLSLDRGVAMDEPLRLRLLSTGRAGDAPSAAFPRLLVAAGEGSRAALELEHASIGEAAGFTALVGELHLGAAAQLEVVQIQREAAARIHFTSLHARLERQARLDSHVFTLGGGLTRSELEVVLAEPGAETRMRGFFLGRDSGHVDHYTTVDHAADHCSSDEEYRGVLAGRSHGVFRGRVIVRPGAQKTDASQSNPNLLISPHASVDAKPQLEIYADDVKASHGSTIGQLDPDALFFLRSRGIDGDQARLLLTRAFAQTIVDGVDDEAMRAAVAEQVGDALADLALAAPGAEREGSP